MQAINDVQVYLSAILSKRSGKDLGPLMTLFHEAQQKCFDNGILFVFVPYGSDHLAIVCPWPEKARITLVR